jgi:hypothetical protein
MLEEWLQLGHRLWCATPAADAVTDHSKIGACSRWGVAGDSLIMPAGCRGSRAG